MPGIGIGISPMLLKNSGIQWSSYWSTRTPSALVLTALSPTSLRAAWTNAGLGFDAHSVEIGTDGVTFVEEDTVLIGTNTLDITGLDSGTLYYVRVRAYKGTEYSPYCDIVSEETIYLPTDLATIFAWYDPEHITGLNDGDTINPFDDSGPNNYDLNEVVGTPSYEINEINGKQVLRLDGNEFIRRLSLTLNQPQTWFILAKRTAGTGTAYLHSYGRDIGFISDTQIRIASGTALNHNTGSILNRALIVTAIFNGANSLLAVNGDAPTEGNAGTGAGSRIEIGDGYSTYFTGDIGDFIIYDGAFDTTNRRRIEEYLSWKWGVELEPI